MYMYTFVILIFTDRNVSLKVRKIVQFSEYVSVVMQFG